MAGVNRLEVFGEMELIESFITSYPQYTHDDAFNFEVRFVMDRVYRNKIASFVSENTQDIMRKINNSKR
jgi:hypothetical protein